MAVKSVIRKLMLFSASTVLLSAFFCCNSIFWSDSKSQYVYQRVLYTSFLV